MRSLGPQTSQNRPVGGGIATATVGAAHTWKAEETSALS